MGLKDIFRRQKTKDDLPEHIINHHQTAEKLNIFGKDMEHQERVYYPDNKSPKEVSVKKIELTEKEAVRLGWSFRKKSKSVRITNYHGNETSVIVPCKIGGMKVNEIGDKCFFQTDVDNVEMPSEIAKIGNDIFNCKIIKRVIFSDGIKFIPEKTFSLASNLCEVHLPYHLNVIGKRAFYACKALKYIEFPDHIMSIEEQAFFSSGLEGFSFNFEKHKPIYKNPFFAFKDGSAFYATPIQQKYRMILIPPKEKNTFIVLTVCSNSDIVFPNESSVYMAKNSVNTTCRLDFSKCHSIDFVQPVFRQDKDPFGSYCCEYFCRVKGVGTEYAFPLFVDTYNRQGDSYNGTYQIKWDNSHTNADVHIHGRNLLSWSLETGAEKIRLQPESDWYIAMDIHQYAINEKNLKSIDLGDFKGIEEIFSPVCAKLHYVSWNKRLYFNPRNPIKIEKYVTPSDILGENISYNRIGKYIHQALLQAFRYVPDQPATYRTPVYYNYRSGDFFDQTVIDRIFKANQVQSHNMTIPLKRKDKILIAIDILRSTRLDYRYKNKTCCEEREMYEKYLREHMHCAERICNKIYDRYPEYAEFFMEFEATMKR